MTDRNSLDRLAAVATAAGHRQREVAPHVHLQPTNLRESKGEAWRAARGLEGGARCPDAWRAMQGRWRAQRHVHAPPPRRAAAPLAHQPLVHRDQVNCAKQEHAGRASFGRERALGGGRSPGQNCNWSRIALSDSCGLLTWLPALGQGQGPRGRELGAPAAEGRHAGSEHTRRDAAHRGSTGRVSRAFTGWQRNILPPPSIARAAAAANLPEREEEARAAPRCGLLGVRATCWGLFVAPRTGPVRPSLSHCGRGIVRSADEQNAPGQPTPRTLLGGRPGVSAPQQPRF